MRTDGSNASDSAARCDDGNGSPFTGPAQTSPIGTANNTTQASGCIYTGHTSLTNILFGDGHVKTMHILATVGPDQGGFGM